MRLPDIIKSKKGQAFLIGLAALLLKNVLGLDEATANQIVAAVGTYLLGQGIADHGKEAAKVIEASDSPKP